ncbi:MAG: hypothetical protein HGA75_05495 [Thiobacillus sp.]|nr:hypothetical protein [Thiobacillus sp.]
MRYLLVVLSLLLCQAAAARTEISVGISVPGLDIGIDMPAYPRLVRVPGHPVYYDPDARANFFFYDGLYWVFVEDDWYASSWYNGPWRRFERDHVPLFVLRIPVRYYRRPPPWFHGWHADAPPRWHEHWGHDWQNRHGDWDKWDRGRMPPPAPLPYYQRRYEGERYPQDADRQRRIESERYHYQPRDEASRRYQQPREERRDGDHRERREERGGDRR